MYFEPLISAKCYAKLQIKQLKKQFTFVCEIGLGGRWVTDEKGVKEKGGSGPPDPPPPPSGHAYACYEDYE